MKQCGQILPSEVELPTAMVLPIDDATSIGLVRPKEYYEGLSYMEVVQEKIQMARKVIPLLQWVVNNKPFNLLVVSGREVAASSGILEDLDRAKLNRREPTLPLVFEGPPADFSLSSLVIDECLLEDFVL